MIISDGSRDFSTSVTDAFKDTEQMLEMFWMLSVGGVAWGEQTRHIFKDAVTQQNVYLLAYFCITAQSSCFMVGTMECFNELRAVKREPAWKYH